MNKPIAIITGASTGIGQSLSIKLSNEYFIYLVSRNKEKLQKTAELIKNKNNQSKMIVADVSRSKSIDLIYSQIKNKQDIENISENPIIDFIDNRNYEVLLGVTNDVGCYSEIIWTICIYPEYTIYVPTAFTPNGDGTNDYFDFGEFAMKDIDVSIYNRWGEMVTNWQDSNHQWDGRGIDGEDLPEGVYYYVLIATGEDGHAYHKKGSITLLR